MRASSRLLAVFLAAVVWIYAGMSVATRPMAQQAIMPSVLGAAPGTVGAVLD